MSHVLGGMGSSKIEMKNHMIDPVNTKKALAILGGFIDREVEVKPIEEFRDPGFRQPITHLGITQLSDNCFRIYLSTEYPEAILIHEILHIILRYEGFRGSFGATRWFLELRIDCDSHLPIPSLWTPLPCFTLRSPVKNLSKLWACLPMWRGKCVAGLGGGKGRGSFCYDGVIQLAGCFLII